MPAYAGPAAARTGDIAGTLRLLAYLAFACALIVLDHQGGWLTRTRQHAQLFMQPLWAVAGWPGAVVDSISDDAGTRSSLIAAGASSGTTSRRTSCARLSSRA